MPEPRPGPAEVVRREPEKPAAALAADRVRMAAVLISLGVGVGLLVVKYLAYRLTGSVAVLSDALESVVNVVAAAFAIGGIAFARRPADESHPYGHGKIEFFSAAFEGGLIAFAAILIVYAAVIGFLEKQPLRALDLGLAITFAASLANASLGWFLVQTGRRVDSLALVASGHHVLSDFWTSLGVIVGLLLVRLTGLEWLDPLVAAIVGLNLGQTGIRLVRTAAGGLLDAVDPELLARLAAALNAAVRPGVIHVHRLRAIRSGRFTHIDAHVVVPEYWTVDRAHDEVEAFAARVIELCRIEGEIAFHIDPCRQSFCARCDAADCQIRLSAYDSRWPLTVEELVGPDQFTGRQGD